MIAMFPKKLVDLGKTPAAKKNGPWGFFPIGVISTKSQSKTCFWVNQNISLIWNKAIWGWFPDTFTMIPVRSQWGHYNLPRCFVLMIPGLIGKQFLFTMNCRGRVRSSVAIHLSNTPDKHISVKGHNITAKRLSHDAFHRKSSTKGTLGVQFQLYIGSRTIVAIVHSSYIPNLW